jgi:hypothetical protein
LARPTPRGEPDAPREVLTEFAEMPYLFDRPTVIDSSLTDRAFNIKPAVLRETAQSIR